MEKATQAVKQAKAQLEADKKADVSSLNAEKNANWQKALGIYNKIVEKFPQLSDYAAYQKGHNAFSLEMDDEALKAKADLTDDDKYYISNSSFDIGYIYWGSKEDLETAKPFFQNVLDYSEVEQYKKIARQALGIEE